MNLTVFGASGQTGLFIVEDAIGHGHAVTALVRSPQTFPISNDRVGVVLGDVRIPSHVENVIVGADAVVCVLGVHLSDAKSTICSDGTRNIIAAMDKHGVKRLVAVTGAGCGDSKDQVGWLGRALMRWTVSLDDKERQEGIIRESGLDWIVVRPPLLTNDPKTGTYRVGSSLGRRVSSRISRGDLAAFVLDQVTDDEYLHQTPTICY